MYFHKYEKRLVAQITDYFLTKHLTLQSLTVYKHTINKSSIKNDELKWIGLETRSLLNLSLIVFATFLENVKLHL